jgi:hypothetical protein
VGEAGADRYGEALISIEPGKIDIFGDEYISQHVLSYIKRDAQHRVFTNYVAEGVRILTENSAKNGGHYLTAKYSDLISPRTEPEETSEQIINRMKGKIRNLSRKGGK